ncbi:hypothetical protein LCGC14_0692050 [marine sediment metagenome]|uniref:Uncharacterized protein n=1 Tax=marine sediment metagenome TaxID=412755 RepID=A0A0F9QK86_9ZZZZ
MTVYLLEAFNTDSRYPSDVRYREYTTSKKRAELFDKIPKIQFTDSGHGVVFSAGEHHGPRKPRSSELSGYVHEQMMLLDPPKKIKTKANDWLVVSLDVGELGEWIFKSQDEAREFRSKLIKDGAEPENINLYYGKITLSRIS